MHVRRAAVLLVPTVLNILTLIAFICALRVPENSAGGDVQMTNIDKA